MLKFPSEIFHRPKQKLQKKIVVQLIARIVISISRVKDVNKKKIHTRLYNARGTSNVYCHVLCFTNVITARYMDASLLISISYSACPCFAKTLQL